MKKHLILLLVVAIAIAIASAPAAMAKCQKCKPAILACGEVETGGYEFCKWTVDNNCYYHTPCTSLLAAPSRPLAAEFTVASVEQLDEPQAAASEPLVASLETQAPVTVTHR